LKYEDLLERARALGPGIRERQEETARLRRLPDATVHELRESQLLRACQPTEYGGFGLPFGTQTDIGIEIARHCGSTGWVTSVFGTHHWIVGMFPPEALDDIWGEDPGALCASAFATATETVERVDGGYRISGRWLFSSGIHAADWCVIMVRQPGDDGEIRRWFMLVPSATWQILDTWNTVGMCGTGTHDFVIDDAFVPDYMAAPVDELSLEVIDGRDYRGTPYQLPFEGPVSWCVSVASIGIAATALEAFCETMGPRVSLMAGKMGDNPVMHLRVAEASAEMDAANALYQKDMAFFRQVCSGNAEFTLADRARTARNAAYVGVLNRRAVTRLSEAMGARGLASDNPVHQARQDIDAGCSHISMVWDANAQPYGQALLQESPAG
jgi:alkylation response protein AidB-like acyl-CoA dehydrogenase